MPKIILEKYHFRFLYALLNEFISVDDDPDEEHVPADVRRTAEELRDLVKYAKYFKVISIEVDTDGDRSDN